LWGAKIEMRGLLFFVEGDKDGFKNSKDRNNQAQKARPKQNQQENRSEGGSPEPERFRERERRKREMIKSLKALQLLSW